MPGSTRPAALYTSRCSSWYWTFQNDNNNPRLSNMLWANFRLNNVAHAEATVKQQWLIFQREVEGFTKEKREKDTWGTAGGKLNFNSMGTEDIRGLGDSWETISLASYFLTAQRTGNWQPQYISNRNFKARGTTEVICMPSSGILNVKDLDET